MTEIIGLVVRYRQGEKSFGAGDELHIKSISEILGVPPGAVKEAARGLDILHEIIPGTANRPAQMGCEVSQLKPLIDVLGRRVDLRRKDEALCYPWLSLKDENEQGDITIKPRGRPYYNKKPEVVLKRR